MSSEKFQQNLIGQITPKCDKCLKRSLIRITCKCAKNYCFKCRVPESHDCTFDYQDRARLILREQNPLIVTEKLEKL